MSQENEISFFKSKTIILIFRVVMELWDLLP
ncbi:hypothetical protein DFA_03420 [Cavenderia fasciculata]|uniref:Uncharacterized protein n=1 Tax=Cavenderia fasciculata TaxID=261658 RepID=F4PHI8_CACFS|nr:uncharacterized protein DFA_03420 [Cavenderia fasciculata]EGG25172.1 hypothetical protein DFA_03420 [Cavenderia fasciculata]|eukprot:XP_004363023.1 hypothetical protein DFA_03420 [Cavenderia fasciculata]